MRTIKTTQCLALFCCVLLTSACSDEETKNIVKCEEGLSVCGHSCCAYTCLDDVCVNFNSDVLNCGEAGHACEADEICEQGDCKSPSAVCGSNQTWCDGNCVSLSADARHCGDCKITCHDNETCVDGHCTVKCGNNYTLCNQTCVNLDLDAEHCGNCETACDDSTYCKAGQCTCKSGRFDCDNDGICEATSKCPMLCPNEQIDCNGTCTDVKTDAHHCGNCETACSPNQLCENGTCNDDPTNCNETVLPDDPDNIEKTACWGECVDLTSDAKHCGECGHACKQGEKCIEAECKTSDAPDDPNKNACSNDELLCYGKCINPLEDHDNCGDCLHACAENEACVSGKCELQCGELTKCNNACIDTKTSAQNCGACGKTCNTGETCINSACQCDAQHDNCDGNAANGCESTKPCICTPKSKQMCWRGEKANLVDPNDLSKGVKGICQVGEQICDDSGQFWGPCTGGVYPSALSCDIYGNLNGLDNDCDGKIDTVCRSECDLAAGEMSYIGCEYWGAYIDNLITSSYSNHTFVISNPNDTSVNVYIYDKAQAANTSAKPVQTKTIKAHDVVPIELNNTGFNMCKGSGILQNAYRIRSDKPVTAYQFSPLGNPDARSNDASLLLPANVLGKDYIGMTWISESGSGDQLNDHRSYLAVIATEPGETNVTVTTSSDISKTETATIKVTSSTTATTRTVDALPKGEKTTYKLNRFEVLTLMAPVGNSSKLSEAKYNQTGTIINADKNIAVFGGSRSSYVPDNTAGCCRDHLEEQLFPTQAWGKSYLAARAYTGGKAGDFWLITARDNNTTITLTTGLKDLHNGSASIPSTIKLNAGQTYAAFESRIPFEINADKPISVGQFLPSQDYNKYQYNGTNIGDPSFLLTVPTEQYRSDYDFMVPTTFNEHYLTIIAPQSAQLTYDSKKLSDSDYVITPEQIGKTKFYVKYLKVLPGVHHMSSNEPFGLYSYGYYNMSSYGYPIGLDLNPDNVN